MRYQRMLNLFLLMLCSGSISLILNLAVLAQSNSGEKPKLKDYGTSLKKSENKEQDKHYEKRRAMKIEVRNHPEYMVIGKKSYFAVEQ